MDELISWCIKYDVHLMLAQTGLPGKWNLDGNGWHDDYAYWRAEENVASCTELFESKEMQKAYTAYYDMLAKRYQDIPNGILSFELATENDVRAEDLEPALHLQAEVLGPVAQTIWSYSPDRIVIVNELWTAVPRKLAAMGCCVAKHAFVDALGDGSNGWPIPFVPGLVDGTSGSLILTAESSFKAGEFTVGYDYYDGMPEIIADGKSVPISVDEKNKTFGGQIPEETKKIELKASGEMKFDWASLSQKGREAIRLSATHASAYPMPLPQFIVADNGSLTRQDGSSADMNVDDFVNAYMKEAMDCAAEYGVSFIATEIGQDEVGGASPEKYVAYHEMVLQAYKENGIGWMYNCVHNILAPESLMWFNKENSKFTDFSKVSNMYGYQVNNTIMDMLKKYQ